RGGHAGKGGGFLSGGGLMIAGSRIWFLLGGGEKTATAVTMPAVSEWAVANKTVGIPARAPPTCGRKSTRATHSAQSSGNGIRRARSVKKTTTPAITEVRMFPAM